MRQGDLVTRKSYNDDVVFRIEQFFGGTATLKGIEYRLLADSPLGDLSKVVTAPHRSDARAMLRTQETAIKLNQFRQSQKERNETNIPKKERDNEPFFELPGKVLHLDGDPTYLRKSMEVYGQLRIPAEGYFIPETKMAETLRHLLPLSKPDILVITGHDGILKNYKQRGIHHLGSYKNSNHFVSAVKVARSFEKNLDTLTVIAGACQSYFEALLQAGANFASSPARILIHALDPVYIAAKSSFTSIKDTINIYDVINHTMSGMEGLGGIETRGSYRVGLPKIKK